MSSARNSPEADELLKLMREMGGAAVRMEKSFVAMGKRVHEGNETLTRLREMIGELLEAQRHTAHVLQHQTGVLVGQTELLCELVKEVAHLRPGNLYPRVTGISVTE
jgi:hypothetical protein